MYSAPPVSLPVANPNRSRGAAGVPLVALCCLVFTLLAIAAVVVIALIPLYLPRTNIQPAEFLPTQYVIGEITGPFFEDNELDSTARTIFGNEMSKAFGFPIGSVNLIKGIFATKRSGRRRRGKPVYDGDQKFYGAYNLRRELCGACIVRDKQKVITVTIPISQPDNSRTKREMISALESASTRVDRATTITVTVILVLTIVTIVIDFPSLVLPPVTITVPTTTTTFLPPTSQPLG